MSLDPGTGKQNYPWIHPFMDGNGRTTGPLGDFAFIAAQSSESLELLDWNVDKRKYI
ncbi:MAG: hypothetical protein WAS54_08700 [Scrofimicrobium sp.]